MNAALLTWGYHLVGQAGFKMGALAAPDEIPSETYPQQDASAR